MYLHGNYFSNQLNRKKNFVAVLPQKVDDQTRVLILLHGVTSDELDWSLNVPLVRYAEQYNIAFFCPAAENSFYTDHADGENYGEALGSEFLKTMAALFQLNFQRENVAIAGFSMGGYGALLLGLRYADYYGRIGGFSPAFVFYKKERNEAHYQLVFSKGDYGSENDCLVWYQKLFEEKKAIPPIQLACGLEDPLWAETAHFVEKVNNLDKNNEIEFVSQPGFHDYGLWETDLLRFIEKWQEEKA